MLRDLQACHLRCGLRHSRAALHRWRFASQLPVLVGGVLVSQSMRRDAQFSLRQPKLLHDIAKVRDCLLKRSLRIADAVVLVSRHAPCALDRNDAGWRIDWYMPQPTSLGATMQAQMVTGALRRRVCLFRRNHVYVRAEHHGLFESKAEAMHQFHSRSRVFVIGGDGIDDLVGIDPLIAPGLALGRDIAAAVQPSIADIRTNRLDELRLA